MRALFPGDDYIEDQNFSLLHRTVLGLNSLDLRVLLAKMSIAEVNKCDASGKTALWWATSRADYNATSLLLSRGADVNKKSSIGYSPIHAAMFARNQTVIQLLLKHGCDIAHDPQGWLPLHRGAFYGCDLKILETIQALGVDVNTTIPSTGSTALQLAVQENHYHNCEFLLAKGADLDIVNNDRESALHVAVLYNSHKPLTLLLQNHANYLLRTKAGENILHYAAQFGDLECLRTLHAHDLHALKTEDKVTGESPIQRFKGLKNLDALEITYRRDDVTPEWHAMFRKLLRGIRSPESKISEANADLDIEEFHDALEHMNS